jgi:N-carbamoylputrescine amidase
MSVRIAALQLGSASEERHRQVDRISQLVDHAADTGAVIACLPELALSSYFSLEFSRANEHHFFSVDDEVVSAISQRCRERNIALILPFAESSGPVPYNTALVIDQTGAIVGRYRKAHLPGSFPLPPDPPISTYERLAFAPGNDRFPVFHVAGLTIGIQICYDMNFPEGFRCLALKGAELIFYPTNGFDFRSNPKQSNGADSDFVARTRAYENTVFLLKVNKRGSEHGRTFSSPTRLIGPRGEIISTLESTEDDVLVGEIDRDSVIEARRRLPWGRDRRPELYRDLACIV